MAMKFRPNGIPDFTSFFSLKKAPVSEVNLRQKAVEEFLPDCSFPVFRVEASGDGAKSMTATGRRGFCFEGS